MNKKGTFNRMLAGVLSLASIVVSCKGKLAEADEINLDIVPFQVIDTTFLVRTLNGRIDFRMETPRMERYDTDSVSYDLFPSGVQVFAYNGEGLLETTIVADRARHTVSKNNQDEVWGAFGNVVVKNTINHQVMHTDTLYWDQLKSELYTDSFVRMESPDGLLQGYGMRSDDHAKNAILYKPFNSYGYVEQDSTKVRLDTLNFIGPFQSGGKK